MNPHNPSQHPKKADQCAYPRPIALATTFTSAPGIFSQMLAIVFMKLIFVASIELLAYLISSAVERLVLIIAGKSVTVEAFV